MSQATETQSFNLRSSATTVGYGIGYAWRTARVWWYSAWLRTLARFSRTMFGSFWLGLSNLLSVTLLAVVYGAVLKVPSPMDYAIYLGFGLTIWGLISSTINTACGLFTRRRDQLINNGLPAVFYCLEEWAFQIQTFAQALIVIIVIAAFIKPLIIVNLITSVWIPLINLLLFCFWVLVSTALLGARFKDIEQLTPIALQLLFLLSPILFHKDGLGSLSFLADANPIYQILESVRSALIHGNFNWSSGLIGLGVNLALCILAMHSLKKLRYKLPFWA